jgi:hypothetical protein
MQDAGWAAQRQRLLTKIDPLQSGTFCCAGLTLVFAWNSQQPATSQRGNAVSRPLDSRQLITAIQSRRHDPSHIVVAWCLIKQLLSIDVAVWLLSRSKHRQCRDVLQHTRSRERKNKTKQTQTFAVGPLQTVSIRWQLSTMSASSIAKRYEAWFADLVEDDSRKFNSGGFIKPKSRRPVTIVTTHGLRRHSRKKSQDKIPRYIQRANAIHGQARRPSLGALPKLVADKVQEEVRGILACKTIDRQYMWTTYL